VTERLQKWLAATGRGSRRQMEQWIADGRVSVDGKPAVLGQKVSGDERIKVDGRLVLEKRPAAGRPVILLYHKPVGEICTRSDPEGRTTVFDALPRPGRGRWISVGRLDIQTSGLLIFTSDGELANALMHPSAGIEREYAVRVQGDVSRETLKRLRRGVDLDDGSGLFDLVEFSGGEGRNRWFRVVVSEGRNRLVRRLWEAVDCRVTRLIRTRYGPVKLPRSLARGRSMNLNPEGVAELCTAAGREPPVVPTHRGRTKRHGGSRQWAKKR
jgi:23S rRNA pseudouridine2605 synthase